MIQVRESRIADYIDKTSELMQANWDETGFDFPLNLNKEMYVRFEQMGILVVIGAFDGDEVVGYSIASVLPHPYNPEIACCNSDCLFLRKDYRHTNAGARLVLETERVAKQRGAHRMLWHARGDTEFVDVLLKRNYEVADVILMKRL